MVILVHLMNLVKVLPFLMYFARQRSHCFIFLEFTNSLLYVYVSLWLLERGCILPIVELICRRALSLTLRMRYFPSK